MHKTHTICVWMCACVHSYMQLAFMSSLRDGKGKKFGPCAPDKTTEAQRSEGIRGIQVCGLAVEHAFFSPGATCLFSCHHFCCWTANQRIPEGSDLGQHRCQGGGQSLKHFSDCADNVLAAEWALGWKPIPAHGILSGCPSCPLPSAAKSCWQLRVQTANKLNLQEPQSIIFPTKGASCQSIPSH